MKKALITGVTGQDGAYLSQYLLSLGYEVHGVKRRASQLNTDRIDHLFEDLHEQSGKFYLHYGDLTDSSNLLRLLAKIRPDEVYNLGAMSHVQVSFSEPEYAANVDAMGFLRILEAVRSAGLENSTRIYQASTSEMFGMVQEVPQTERTPFYPRSPYGVAKLYAHWIGVNYREAYGMFICNGILFNHESPLRGETFVTRKITRGIAQMAYGKSHCLYLGNLNAERDWGHAKDYVVAMHAMLQLNEPDDFVIASNRTVSVRDFVKLAFACIGVELKFEGSGKEEIGIVLESKDGRWPFALGQVVVRVDSRYFRPTEVDQLKGNPAKAKEKLGWEPRTSLEDLVAEMMDADLELMERVRVLDGKGLKFIVPK
jgi:GDPmannose 4,6-dehydratase